MRSLLAAGAVLLAMAAKVIAVPMDASLDNSCIGDRCVYIPDKDVPTQLDAIGENGVPIVGDHGLEAITAEQIGKNKGIVTKCNGDGDCPMSYHYVYRNMKGYCYCGPEPKDPSVSIAGPTTAENLTSRLLPQPLKFPTAIPADEWVAIQASLVLLDDHIKSQADLYRVCTGAEDPQVYGFKLEVFRKVCNPEITMPAPSSEIVKARNRVLSALYIDTILEQNSNDFGAACEEAKSPNTPDRGFDNEWIVSVLCSEAR